MISVFMILIRALIPYKTSYRYKKLYCGNKTVVMSTMGNPVLVRRRHYAGPAPVCSSTNVHCSRVVVSYCGVVLVTLVSFARVTRTIILWSHLYHRNGKVVTVTALVVTANVETCHQRLQSLPGQTSWRPFRFSDSFEALWRHVATEN